MPSDFLFAIELTHESASERMVADLAAAVCSFAGLTRDAVDELNGALRQQLAADAAQERRRCRVWFQAASGTLTIGVARHGGAEWQTKRRLP